MFSVQLSYPQVEQAALKKEKDPLSQARLGQVEVELAQLQEQLSPLQIRCVLGGGGGGLRQSTI
jgi:hypothetical protein